MVAISEPAEVSSVRQNVVFINEEPTEIAYSMNNAVRGSIIILEEPQTGRRIDSVAPELIVECLIPEEGGGSEFAMGDPRWIYGCNNVLFPSDYCAFGPLQFWQTTWKSYCMDQYGMTAEDIRDWDKQKACAAQMIRDDPNNTKHWTTAYKCI